MKRLTYVSENVNTWNDKKIENITQFELECSACSATDSFSLKNSDDTIWRWEIHIPYDWEYNQWERILLYPVEVQIPVVECSACGEKYRVYPSFVVEGTTLTQSALIFIAFAYESSTLTWRELPEKFCDETNKIAHSTLYKAVHGLGQSIIENEQVRKELDSLTARYLTAKEEPASNRPPSKSIYEHTINRENAVRETLFPFTCQYLANNFTHFFYKYLRQLSTVLLSLKPPIYILYHKQNKTPSPPSSLANNETQKAC